MDQSQPTTITLSINLVQAIATYLETQPYKDVAVLLGGLNSEANQQPQPAPVAPEAPTTAPVADAPADEGTVTPPVEDIAAEVEKVE